VGLIIHVDGGSRGNPGPAGAGVVIEAEDGGLVHEAGYFLGRQTNNAAEYHACIRALQRAARCAEQPVRICSDSELLVRQITGAYQVKSPTLEQLYRQVQMLLLKVRSWQFQHVKREQNRRADQLANMAMDAGDDVIVFDADDGATPAERGGKERANSKVPPAESPRAAGAAVSDGPRSMRVEIATAPANGACPAGGFEAGAYTVDSRLPPGWCLHAAQTLVPTLLAMQNTEPQEFAAIPVLTLRCTRSGCGAVFRVAPQAAPNGQPRGAN
jgi:ribonuclease HI